MNFRWLLALSALVLAMNGAMADDGSGPRHAAASDPLTRARVHTELGSLYLQEQQLGVALEEARQAVQADSSYAPGYNLLGLVHMVLRENDKAQQAFERALRLAPTDADVNNNFGWFLCQTQREKESIAYFLAAIKNPLYATPARSWVNAGICQARMKEDEQARDSFSRALQFDPRNGQALYQLAVLDYRRGQYAEARRKLARFGESVEPGADALWLSARIDRRLGDRDGEARAVAQLRRRFPDSAEYQAFLKGQFE